MSKKFKLWYDAGEAPNGECPECGNDFEYLGDSQDGDDGPMYKWECTSCGAIGYQHYSQVYTGQEIEEHGNLFVDEDEDDVN